VDAEGEEEVFLGGGEVAEAVEDHGDDRAEAETMLAMAAALLRNVPGTSA
jgi:hypothetical protein